MDIIQIIINNRFAYLVSIIMFLITSYDVIAPWWSKLFAILVLIVLDTIVIYVFKDKYNRFRPG